MKLQKISITIGHRFDGAFDLIIQVEDQPPLIRTYATLAKAEKNKRKAEQNLNAIGTVHRVPKGTAQ